MGIGWRSRLARLLGPSVVLFTIFQGVLLRDASRQHDTSKQDAASFQAPNIKEAFRHINSAQGSTTAQIEDPSDSSRVLEKANTPNAISLGLVKQSPLQPKKSTKVSGSAPVEEDEYCKTLFWLFPGSGEHYLECSLDPSANGLLIRYLTGSSSNAEEKMNKDVMLGSVPKKRVILVRHPLDAIWERYEHAQTASLTRHIQERDFHLRHFELQALAWAKEYRDVVEKYIIPYIGDHNATTFLVKYEDLANGPRQTLNSILDFLGEDDEPTVKNSTSTRHCINGRFFRNQEVGADHVNKSTAFSNPWFISTLWDVVQKSAERLGYTKPSLQLHGNATPFDVEIPLPQGRYLTYLPSGGGLSDQLLELEIAVQLAIQSGRKLILTPLMIGEYPPIPKNCNAHAGGLCDTNLAEAHTNDPFLWSDIIDIGELSEKVEVLERPHGDIPLKFSELTLCEFDRCTTHWGLHELRKEGEECLLDFSLGPRRSFNLSQARAIRSTRCLFEATKEVSVLRFVDLTGTVDRNFVSAQVGYTKSILTFARNKILKPIQDFTGGGAMYVCAELRTSRAEYHHTQAISEQLEAYFKELDSENQIMLYVSTENHTLEKEHLDICANRTCLFARDYFKHASKDIFWFSAIDHFVCSQAHRVFTLSNETDWYTERLHRRRPSGWNDVDACPRMKYPQNESISDVDDEKCRRLSITKETESAQNTTENTEGHSGFGGCLLIMDDNHFLIEWLGYHYHAMPLRRLIVAVDPKSKTSPTHILNRYSSRNLMNITVWDDSHFMSSDFVMGHEDKLVYLHRARQRRFTAACLKTLQSEGMSWIMAIDTDEYIVPNRYAWPSCTIQGQERKVVDMLNHPNNRFVNPRATDACHPMIRLPIGTTESTELQVQKNVPFGFNGSEYMTLRYRWPEPVRAKRKVGKALVDVSKIPPQDILHENASPHRPNEIHCAENGMFIKPRESPFVVYHYTGSFEQFNYRVDGRDNRNWKEFQQRAFGAWSDDSIRSWLKSFVDEVGSTLATELLKGAGHVEPWNASTSDV